MKQTIRKIWLIMMVMALVAISAEAYDITLLTPANGTLVVSKTSANKGETVNVMASANAGYVLEGIVVDIYADAGRASSRRRAPQMSNTVTVDKISDGVYTFTMPDYDVEVSATITAVAEIPAQQTDISTAAVTLSTGAFTFNGQQQTPVVSSVKLGGKTLVQGTDYTVTTPASSINVGSYTIVITGQGNYKNTVAAHYVVLAKNLAENMVTLSQNVFTYNGSVQQPVVSVKDEENGVNLLKSDYYEVNVPTSRNKGDYTVMVMGKGNYTGLVSKMYSISGGNAGSFIVTLGRNTYDYDGTAHQPTVSVKMNNQTLTEGAAGDYTLLYRDNVNAGTATVTVVGQNNFGGQQEKTFSIRQRELKAEYVTLSAEQYTYNGEIQRPEVTVADGSRLKESDYALTFTSSKNVGSYQVSVVGKGNYHGAVTKSYNIGKLSLTGAAITLNTLSSYVYDGKAKTPSVLEVTAGGVSIPHSGYSVSYSNNVNAGTATVTITGQDNYEGTATQTFTITKKEVTASMMTLAPASFTFTGAVQKPVVTLKDGDKMLVLNTDYVLINDGGTNIGTYAVSIQGKGNYQGSVSKDFFITAKDIKSLPVGLQYETVAYDGTEKKPTVTISDGTIKLEADADYSLQFSNNTNVGTATVTITGTGNYQGSTSKTFSITAKAITSDMVKLSQTSFAYNGQQQRPEVTVTDGSNELIENSDFALKNIGGTNVGTYTAEVIGRGNYQGTVKTEFTITKATIVNATVTLNELNSYIYDGKEKTPTVAEVSMNGSVVPRVGYETTYSDNINAGTATVIVTGKGNYEGTAKQTFHIITKEIESAMIELSQDSFTFNGKTQHPEVVVRRGSIVLTLDTDYSVAFNDSANVGNYSVKVTGLGNYSGETEMQYSITPKQISTLTMVLSKETFVYTGEAQKPSLKVTDGTNQLTEGKHYSIAYADNVNAGTATVTISGQGDYSGTASKTFVITPKSLNASMAILSDENYVFNGKLQIPNVTIKDGDKVLNIENDYQLSYGNPVSVGNYFVTITGKGNYNGMVEKQYSIVAKDASTFDLALKMTEMTYTGDSLKPALSVKDGSSQLTEGVHYIVSYTDNTNVGTATVTVTGKDNYQGTSSKTYTILPKELKSEMIAVSGSLTYNGKLQKPVITVSDGNAMSDTDYIVTNEGGVDAGEYQVVVNAKGNYRGEITLPYIIGKQSLETAQMQLDELSSIVYDGQEKRPIIKEIRVGDMVVPDMAYTVDYVNNVNVGTATVAVSGTGNFTGTIEKTFSIIPKEIVAAMIAMSEDTFTYNGQLQRPELVVKDGESILFKDIDYVVINSGGIVPDNYNVEVTGRGNYQGTAFVHYQITPASLEGASVILVENEKGNYVYDGKEKTPTVLDVIIDEESVPRSNYDVSYEDNLNVGTAKVIIKGKKNFTGTVIHAFDIDAKEIDASMIELSQESFIYNGEIQRPELVVKQGNTTLNFKTDYTVAFDESITVGNYLVKVSGLGNFCGEAEKQYIIMPKEASTFALALAQDTLPYSGEAQKPSLRVTDGIHQLTEDKHYSVAYADNVNAGTATVIITGKGDYSGTQSKTFTIAPKPLAKEMVVLSDTAFIYNSNIQKPIVTVKDSTFLRESDYQLSNEGGVNAGNYVVKVLGRGNYIGEQTLSYSINPQDMETAHVLLNELPSYVYDGHEKCPAVREVVIGNLLLPTTAYGIAYSDNVNAGTATVTLTGMGNYCGQKTLTFTISSKAIEEDMLKLSTDRFIYNGEKQEPVVTVVNGDSTLTKEVDYRVLLDETTEVGKYIVKIEGIGNYKGGAEKEYIIDPMSVAQLNMKMTDTTFVYSGMECRPDIKVKNHERQLEENVDYYAVYKDNLNAGAAEAIIHGIGNYQGTATIRFTILPKELTKNMVALALDTMVYDGNLQKPQVVVADNGLLTEDDYQIENEGGVDAGNYSVIVSAKGNYQGSVIKLFAIVKAPVAEVALTDIVEPATSVALDTAAACDAVGVAAFSKVMWSPKDSVAHAETVYTATLVIFADDNHAFTNNTFVSLNGWEVEDCTLSEDSTSMVINYSFAPTLGQFEMPMAVNDGDSIVTIEGVNFVYTILDEDKKLVCIDGLNVTNSLIDETLSIFIPDSIASVDGTVYKVAAVREYAFCGETNISDIYLPETKQPIRLMDDAFCLNKNSFDASQEAVLHSPLVLLDDYAMMESLKNHYEAGLIKATVRAKNRYWTFSCGVDVRIPSEVKVYTARKRSDTEIEIVEISNSELAMGANIVVKAGNGVVFGSSPEGGSYEIAVCPDRITCGSDIITSDMKDYGENLMEPVIEEKHLDGGNYYILSNNAFYPVAIDDDTMLPACKAVLHMPWGSMSRKLSIVVGEETGVEVVENLTDNMTVQWYDMNGKHIDKPVNKGVYIMRNVNDGNVIKVEIK